LLAYAARDAPSGAANTNVSKKSSPSASRKLVPSQTCNRRAVVFSHCTVFPSDGSAESQESYERYDPVGISSGNTTNCALSRRRVGEGGGATEIGIDIVIGGDHLDRRDAEGTDGGLRRESGHETEKDCDFHAL
jgi:hypothetical protein